jgi:hypothetical protein
MATDVPDGYCEEWRKIISVYPPIDIQTMVGALQGGGYGMPGMFPHFREVRLNAEKNRIEVWERVVKPRTAPVTKLGGQVYGDPREVIVS